MHCSVKRASLVLLLGAFHYMLLGATAKTYKVSVSGDDNTYTIDEAMNLAKAGDFVHLEDGTYKEAIVSKRDGEKGSPITVRGSRKAVINGGFSSKNVRIMHSFIALKGFTVQGKLDNEGTKHSYMKKCVYVNGSDTKSGLDGFVMKDLRIENCGTECVRIKNGVVNAVIRDNDIETCGVHDYKFGSGKKYKNGEGIYIGTSSGQVSGGVDECNNNLVKRNRISTKGNECVDIKEGATGNVVEGNFCENQLDHKSGCYNCRGDHNTIRYNEASGCEGAGVRLGGSEVDGHRYGTGNSVYGNVFSDVGWGALNIVVSGQNKICDNSCDGDECFPLKGGKRFDYDSTWDKDCPSSQASSDGSSDDSSEDSSEDSSKD